MNALDEALVTVHSRAITALTVNNPSPDFSGPGVSALQSIANVVFAIVLTLAHGLHVAVIILAATLGPRRRLNRAQRA